MDAGYKTPWIAKKTFDDGKISILPYTRYNGKKSRYKPWEYTYYPVEDEYICPQGESLRHTTTDRDGKRSYRSTPGKCRNCPCKRKCGANERGQKLLTTHIWQEHLDLVKALRKTERGKEIYAMRKETIERVFADANEKHAMRYTHHRGLAAVTRWVRLKYAAMNLKKLAIWCWNNSFFSHFFSFIRFLYAIPCFRFLKAAVLYQVLRAAAYTAARSFWCQKAAQSLTSFAHAAALAAQPLPWNTFPSTSFAPGQLGVSFCMVLPMPLVPEVAKTTTVLPERS